LTARLSLPSERPPRFLLVRTSALGDIVHALPVLAALRRRHAEAKIAWVVDESLAPLLAGHRMLDRLLSVPLRRWRRPGSGRGRARELRGFVSDLRNFRADVAIDLMGNHKGALIARASGAPLRFGARRADRREAPSALWINRPVTLAGSHSVDRTFSLLAPLGIEPERPLDFAPEALACGEDLVPDAQYFYVHPGAAWGNKRYPPELWGEVAARIATDTSLEAWVGAAPGEEQLADRVVAASGAVARRVEAPTLGHLVGLVRGARLVLGGDTGAIHIARVFAVPLLALHGPTDPELHGPYAAPAGAIDRRLPCSFCHRRMESAKACLVGIDPRRVVERALTLLSTVEV